MIIEHDRIKRKYVLCNIFMSSHQATRIILPRTAHVQICTLSCHMVQSQPYREKQNTECNFVPDSCLTTNQTSATLDHPAHEFRQLMPLYRIELIKPSTMLLTLVLVSAFEPFALTPGFEYDESMQAT